MVKCKFAASPRNPFGISCLSDAQNCGEIVIFYLVVASWPGQLVRNCGEMHILGRTRTSWGGLLSVFSVCVFSVLCVFSVFSVCVALPSKTAEVVAVFKDCHQRLTK